MYIYILFSPPFRVLSERGVKDLRAIVDHYENHAKRSGRQPKSLRGLGYLSLFIRQLNFSPSILKLLSELANTALWPHSMVMNFAHTNFGVIGNKENVDMWHADSVDYVLILVISNMKNMVGGELQVIKMSETGMRGK